MTAARKSNEKMEQMEQKFSKEQILTSARYADRRDLVDAILDEGKSYTRKMVDDMIEKYRKGTVK